jgi:phosphoribosylglycinamide formyltransferase-1
MPAFKVHGCTVHFVTPEVDSGPIIAQAAVPVRLSDDEDSLGIRVLSAEHRLYPRCAGAAGVGQGAAGRRGNRVFTDFIESEHDSAFVSAPSPRPETDRSGKPGAPHTLTRHFSCIHSDASAFSPRITISRR